MAKLYFKYGTMRSSKTANLLMTKYNYESEGISTILIKPEIDDRCEKTIVKSRIGLSAEAISINNTEPITNQIQNYLKKDKKKAILIDETQFFSKEQIDELKQIAYKYDYPVLCYGLLTDFKTELFPGSKRLIEIADSIQEIKSVCSCGKKATVNARYINNEIVIQGDQIMIGDTEYKPLCWECCNKEIQKKKQIH